MNGCWHSGGPNWLFDVSIGGFGSGFVLAGLAAIAWFLPRQRPTKARAHPALQALLIVPGATAVIFSRPPATLVMGAGVLCVCAVATVMVSARITKDRWNGAPSPARWVAALHTIRWSTAVGVLGCFAAAAWATVSMVLQGHAC